MAELTFKSGRTVFLDDEDLPKVRGYKWRVDTRHGTPFVHGHLNGEVKMVRMNKVILAVPSDSSKMIKHKNGNALDLRQENLEIKERAWQRTLPDIECACGCGKKMRPYRSCGIRKKFISGHYVKHISDAELHLAHVQWNSTKRANSKCSYRRRKMLCLEFFGNVCYFCGLSYDGTNATAFEFDHINPSTKNEGVTQLLRRRDLGAALNELHKCRLVCANCHNRRHGGEW